MKPIYIIVLATVLITGAAGAIYTVQKPETLEVVKNDLIVIDNPRLNQSVENPLFAKGEARGNWYFEASFPVKIYDNNNFLLGVRPAQALGEWMTTNFVPFSLNIPFSVPGTMQGKVIFQKDNPSGLPENDAELIVPVSFKEMAGVSQELMTVKMYLSDSRYINEPYFNCQKTIAVNRQVPKTAGVARASIEALLRGATQDEVNQGFFSSIGNGVRIQKLTIENGTAKIDFDEQLEYQMGGSCKVSAVRAQIIDTLKQFSTVQNVIISVNDRTEDILQP